jgi:hypothetical protein
MRLNPDTTWRRLVCGWALHLTALTVAAVTAWYALRRMQADHRPDWIIALAAASMAYPVLVLAWRTFVLSDEIYANWPVRHQMGRR